MILRMASISVSAVALFALGMAAPAAAATGTSETSSAPSLAACLNLSGNGPGAALVENSCNHSVRFKVIYPYGPGECQVIGANDQKYVRDGAIRVTRAGC